MFHRDYLLELQNKKKRRGLKNKNESKRLYRDKRSAVL